MEKMPDAPLRHCCRTACRCRGGHAVPCDIEEGQGGDLQGRCRCTEPAGPRPRQVHEELHDQPRRSARSGERARGAAEAMMGAGWISDANRLLRPLVRGVRIELTREQSSTANKGV